MGLTPHHSNVYPSSPNDGSVENRALEDEWLVFKGSIFHGTMLVGKRVYQYHLSINPCQLDQQTPPRCPLTSRKTNSPLRRTRPGSTVVNWSFPQQVKGEGGKGEFLRSILFLVSLFCCLSFSNRWVCITIFHYLWEVAPKQSQLLLGKPPITYPFPAFECSGNAMGCGKKWSSQPLLVSQVGIPRRSSRDFATTSPEYFNECPLQRGLFQ